MNVFDLVAKISVDSSSYESGVSKAASYAKNALLGATGAIAVATGIAGKKLVDGAKQTAEYGDTVDKMSQKLGLSAESYQKWDYVLNIAGTDMASMTTGLKTLTNKIDDAKNGSTDAQEMFSKLGISMDDLSKMSREEIFEATIKGFQGMQDSTERAALANDLFGRSGQNLTPLFNQTADATKEQLELAEKYGMVMPDSAVKASAGFKDSITTMQMTMKGLKNRMMSDFLPAMTKVTDGLAKLFAGDMSGAEEIGKGIEEVINKMSEILPKILEVGGSIIKSLADAILNNIPNLIPVITQMIVSFTQYFIEALPQIAQIGVEIITSLVNAIVESLPQLITVFVDAIIQIATSIVEALPQLIEAFVSAIPAIILALEENYPRLIEAGFLLFTSLVGALPEIITAIVDVLPLIIEGIISTIISNIQVFIEAGIQLFTALVQALPEIIEAIVDVIPDIIDAVITTLLDNLPLLIDAGVELFIALVENLPLIIDTIIKALPKIITAIVNTLAQNIPKIIEAGVKLFVALIKNLPKIIVEIVKAIPQIIAALVKGFGEGIVALADVGIELVKGLWGGIKSAAGWLWDKVSGWLGDLWDGIKSFFGISSPSKEMAWIGEMISRGLAGGIEDSAKEAIDAATSLSDEVMNAINPNMDINQNMALAASGSGAGGLYGGANMGDVTINVYASDGMDVNELALKIEDKLTQIQRQRVSAWA